jgi:hypothetical protein
MPDIKVTQPHIQEAESFQAGIETLYEALKRAQQPDEEIALFYESGKETVRVHGIKMANDSVLVLTGKDSSGNLVAVAGHFTSINIIYRKLKISPDAKRTPIGFSKTME